MQSSASRQLSSHVYLLYFIGSTQEYFAYVTATIDTYYCCIFSEWNVTNPNISSIWNSNICSGPRKGNFVFQKNYL